MPAIGVAGTGLIGGSIALRAVELGWDVAIFEPEASHRRIACERLGSVTVCDTLAELAACSQTLVLAAPLEATLEALGRLAAGTGGGPGLVVDVASVKAPVARAGAGVANFCPTHPIAGSERSGPLAARADLFAGRVWSYESAALTATRDRVVAFIEAMGATAVPIASDEHDRVVALTSHLPQILSVALASRLASGAERASNVYDFCGTGIRSMLRLAGSSWLVWRAVLSANAVPLAQEVRELADVLSHIATALDADSERELGRYFERAARVFERLDANVPAAGDVTPATGSDQLSNER